MIRPPQRLYPQKRIKTLKRLCSCVQYSILLLLFILVVMLVGKHVEENHVQRAPSTVDLYTKPQVCALLNVPEDILNTTSDASASSQRSSRLSEPPHDRVLQSNSTFLIQTLPNITVARDTPNTLVAHCGDCGQCSTPRDVQIYDATKNSLTDTATHCAKLALIGGRRRATKCMQDRVGLSEGCTECWVDNFICTITNCVFTCLWRQMTSWGEKKSNGGALNECTKCDELRCGRAFLECAGANRRQTGIVSDIERDDDQEVCRDADEAFWRSQELRMWYQSVVTNETTKNETTFGDTRLLRGLGA